MIYRLLLLHALLYAMKIRHVTCWRGTATSTTAVKLVTKCYGDVDTDEVAIRGPDGDYLGFMYNTTVQQNDSTDERCSAASVNSVLTGTIRIECSPNCFVHKKGSCSTLCEDQSTVITAGDTFIVAHSPVEMSVGCASAGVDCQCSDSLTCTTGAPDDGEPPSGASGGQGGTGTATSDASHRSYSRACLAPLLAFLVVVQG